MPNFDDVYLYKYKVLDYGLICTKITQNEV